MSNTRRKAEEDLTFHVERYASSQAFGKPLPGNIVANRSKLILDPQDRALVYWIQQCSHREGGLERLTADLCAEFPERIGTPAIRRFRKSGKKVVTPQDASQIRLGAPSSFHVPAEGCEASVLEEKIHQFALGRLPDHLRMICVNPEVDLDLKAGRTNNIYSEGKSPEVWCFQGLIDALHRLRRSEIEQAEKDLATTSISQRVLEDMEYALESRSLVVIEGLERMGKSAAAKSFCRRNPGKAIYVRLESGTDMATFFRAIAKALGTACNAQRKAVEMRTRIEEMLQHGHLMLVMDEAHHCFPQARRVHNAPPRVEWLRDMIDCGVPVVMVGTPQFDRQCRQHEEQVGWNARQVRGRVALHTILPEQLSEADLKAIAQHMMPNADKASLLRLVAVACATVDYVAAIERVTKRAKYFAAKRGSDEPTAEDVKKAVAEIIPAQAQEERAEIPAAPVESNPETIFQGRLNSLETPFKGRLKAPRIDPSTIELPTERRTPAGEAAHA